MSISRQEGGRQRDWDKVRTQTDKPIITIITSTYNVAQVLHWTLDSIRKQTYENVQWIVADGASTDDTVELLRQHSDVIDYWFSEPDTGIYDAWNKALEYIQGDWVQFIGAGDELFETDTLEKVAVYLIDAYPNYDLVYGKVMHVSEKNRKELYVSGEPWENYKNKWEIGRPKLPSHPAVYHHNSLFLENEFNSKFKIVADSLFLLNYINNPFLYIPIIIDKMPSGGISSSSIGSVKCYEELLKVNKLLNIKAPYKVKVNAKLRYLFTKSSLLFLTEEKYVRLMEVIKRMRNKPKSFTP